MEGATQRGGLTVNCEVKRLTLPGAALAAKIWGSLPPPSPLSCGAPPRRQGGGTREAQPRFALWRQTREILVVPCLTRCLAKGLNHGGEDSVL